MPELPQLPDVLCEARPCRHLCPGARLGVLVWPVHALNGIGRGCEWVKLGLDEMKIKLMMIPSLCPLLPVVHCLAIEQKHDQA